MSKQVLPILTLAALTVSSCDRKPADAGGRPATVSALPPAIEQAVKERGNAAVAQAFSILSSNLTAALSQGGPTNALPFCSVNAEPLTASVSPSGDVAVRRVSHRARNPKNKTTDAEFSVLQEFDNSEPRLVGQRLKNRDQLFHFKKLLSFSGIPGN